MKGQCLRKLLTMLLIAAATLPSYGQTTGQASRVMVFIPFAFVVGDKTMRSGSYEVTITAERALSVQSTDGSEHAFVSTIAVKAADDFARVVFDCYSHRCFLSKVWATGHELGWEVMKTQSEKQLAERSSLSEIALSNR